MATQAPPAPRPKTGIEKWQDGINKAAGNAKWDFWDCEIQMVVNDYNRHLTGTPGYMPLGWQLVKAMLWVETGAENSQWNSKPMQIGVKNDQGMTSLLFGDEGGDLIMPPAIKERLTAASVRTNPAHNIRAGVGYLLMRLAKFEYKSVLGTDPKVYEIIVKAGDNLDKIAKAQGSTTEVLRKLNPTVGVLVRPGQVLKYQKASVQRVITGWRPRSTEMIAQRYNGYGDPDYAKKLDHALSSIRKAKAVSCAQ